jgi:diguanylate cyclase (GGDEF)-like protein
VGGTHQDGKRRRTRHLDAAAPWVGGMAGGARRRWVWARRAGASVRVRLTMAFLLVSLLVPMVGMLAVREQYAASRRAARIEARHVAEPLAHTIANTAKLTGGDQPPLYLQPVRLQEYVSNIHRDLGRDMVVVDAHGRILAHVVAANRGQAFDLGGEVAATIRDGRPRTFVERSADYPQGILQVVVPLRTEQDTTVGAVVMEYTPIYRELVAAGAGTRRITLAASAAGLLLALLLAYGLARGLVADLRRLGRAAGRLAEGHDHARAQVRSRGELAELAAAFNDMAARTAAQKAVLAEVAISDPLTGLHNRRAFQARLAEEVERANRTGVPFALLLLDLDCFKALNDTLGHPAGDAVLRAVAEVLRRELRAVDLPARVGGEEFAVLLPQTAGQGALDAAERLRAAIAAQPIAHQDAALAVTTSVGVAWYPEQAAGDQDLVQAADRALYAAKRAGRDRVRSAVDVQASPERA